LKTSQGQSTVKNGKRYSKASSADHGTKIEAIRKNAHTSSVSAMCKALQISRSTAYVEVSKERTNKQCERDNDITEAIIQVFNSNRKCVGTRRIKNALHKQGLIVSRRRIGRIMKQNNLVSTYTVASYKPYPSKSNERLITNGLDRNFNRAQPMEVIVSDLTYVKVAGKWHYICVFIDLFNREIVGYSAGSRKNAALVSSAISTIK